MWEARHDLSCRVCRRVSACAAFSSRAMGAFLAVAGDTDTFQLSWRPRNTPSRTPIHDGSCVLRTADDTGSKSSRRLARDSFVVPGAGVAGPWTVDSVTPSPCTPVTPVISIPLGLDFPGSGSGSGDGSGCGSSACNGPLALSGCYGCGNGSDRFPVSSPTSLPRLSRGSAELFRGVGVGVGSNASSLRQPQHSAAAVVTSNSPSLVRHRTLPRRVRSLSPTSLPHHLSLAPALGDGCVRPQQLRELRDSIAALEVTCARSEAEVRSLRTTPRWIARRPRVKAMLGWLARSE